ncbi:MAG TPA: hypothetical protein RMH99_13565 [Sandaracinaceae bacterium LLY-WYZ-13_1]|nr:hypothetical protein [Sandaracinaceae bacterium LLY-WYZ-13_1]
MRARLFAIGCLSLAPLVGCDPGADMDPTTDGGPAGDAGPAPFEVRLEHAEGEPIEDGDALEVETGCQGGHHVFVDVVAEGDGLDRALAEIEMREGGEAVAMQSARLAGTGGTATLRGWMFILGFGPPSGLPKDGTLRVTVTRDDGRAVSIERTVRQVEGAVCDPVCRYDDLAGTGALTEVMPPETTGCEAGPARLTFDFDSDAGLTEESATLEERLPADCVDALGLEVGAEVPVIRQQLLPGGATCQPVIYRLDVDRAPCEALCPAEG